MISCYELRIGNYVIVGDCIQRITMINNKLLPEDLPSIGCEDQAENRGQHHLDNIQAVPLNDEILKRCGFVYHTYFKFWQLMAAEGGIRSEMDIDGDYNIIDFMRQPVVKSIDSLHRLQNLYFILKGKELNFHADA